MGPWEQDWTLLTDVSINEDTLCSSASLRIAIWWHSSVRSRCNDTDIVFILTFGGCDQFLFGVDIRHLLANVELTIGIRMASAYEKRYQITSPLTISRGPVACTILADSDTASIHL